MTKSENPKAIAWDTIGKSYWNAGYQGGPTGQDLEAYLIGVKAGTQIAVVGASTRGLIGEALDRGAEVSVLDFSQRMCDALAEEVDQTRCRIVHHDILLPIPKIFCGKHQFVLADRLINRFAEREVVPALTQMLRLLTDNGQIRTSIRLGLYERDLPLINEGRRRGVLGRFFDEATWNIDYGAAGDILEQCIAPHGNIPMDVLLKFYRLRGCEKRFNDGDIRHYVTKVKSDNRGMMIVRAAPLPTTPADTLYTFAPMFPRDQIAASS